MSDQIGRIVLNNPTPSLTFPLKTDYGHGRSRKRQVIVHTLGSANAKIEQRYHYGDPATRFNFVRRSLSNPERKQLWEFWESVQGTNLPFYYAAPNADRSTTTKTVVFDSAPLSFEDLSDAICSTGLTFIEVPSTGPTYSVNATVTRFPGSTLGAALQDQAQEIIPLVRIRVLDESVPDMLFSDRRVTIGSDAYLPRLLRMNEPGSTAIMTQNIDGSTDDVNLTFGNADRVMTQVANDTQLRWARVELSIFHVGTGILLNLWAGYAIDWKTDKANPEFTLKASDLLSALTLSSPVSSISRDCWRRYKLDGCPATGSVDGNFPDGDANSCDNSFNGPNGCMCHQATQSYGATYCSPQGVLLRSGHLNPLAFITSATMGQPFGAFTGSTWYPRTSSIMDTIFGGPLAEIWHNDDGNVNWGLPVPCVIAAGRDEDEYYSALGILGKGPLGAYTNPQMWTSYGATHPDTFIGTTLDGMPNHGFHVDSNGNVTSGDKSGYGLRQILGTDPAGDGDYFSQGRVATTAQGWFVQGSDGSKMLEIVDSGSAYNKVYAAGLAFVEIRRLKPANDPITIPSQHAVVAIVSRGLTGFSWTAPGSRGTIAGCTNPIWVAINTYLAAIGSLGLDTSVQEATFDVAAAITSATTCDYSVPVIVGSGNETQFRFKGIIKDRKPTRDWLQSILNNCLGFYTWSFGKLKIGMRINASPQSAFTSGNMLFNSLSLVPIQPKFEKLTVGFQDQDYQFQPNTIDYLDRELAARNRRIGNPLAQTFPISGCPTKSQAARVAIGRAREEHGGAVQSEQDAARMASWKSTILALDAEAGGVVSITDPEVPGGVGDFRVQSMTINTDWSVNLNGKTVTASMYDKEVGPTVIDVQPAPVPIEPARDVDAPPTPTFGVEASAIDPTVAQIAGLSFPDSANTHSVNGASFTLYYADPNASPDFLAASLSSGASTMHLNVDTDITAGEYVLVGEEIVKCGTPDTSTGIVPITRAQLGSTAASVASGAPVHRIMQKTVTASFTDDFFNTDPDAPFWTLDVSLPGMLLCTVAGYATNAYGASDIVYVQAGAGGEGLDLSANPTSDLVVNIINTGSPSAPYVLTAVQQKVNIIATTQDVYVQLPNEEDMVGKDIVINLSMGNTHAAYLVLDPSMPIPDTLEGSADNYEVKLPSITIEGT